MHFHHRPSQFSGEESEEEEEAEERGQSESSEEIVDTFRVIGLRRRKGESLVSYFSLFEYLDRRIFRNAFSIFARMS